MKIQMTLYDNQVRNDTGVLTSCDQKIKVADDIDDIGKILSERKVERVKFDGLIVTAKNIDHLIAALIQSIDQFKTV